MGIIKIDFDKVYNQGEKYNNYSQDFRSYKDRLNEVKEGVKEAWASDENVNFLSLFENHINYMDNFINFVDDKGNLLKSTSKNHSDSEKEFKEQMERSDLKNEYKYWYWEVKCSDR